ncbi:MAG: adenine phosphoribosyltransferase [Promethearchaeota archaeon]
MEKAEKIIEKLRQSPIIEKKGYKYIILPFDIKAVPDEIRFFSDQLEKIIRKTLDCENCDKIITIESKGMIISTLIALKLNKPLFIIRKRSYKLKNEICVRRKTGYDESDLFINGIQDGDKIIIIDDLISTGGTINAILTALNEHRQHCSIKGIFTIFDKYNYQGSANIRKNYKIPVKTLYKFKIKENNNLEVT